MKDENCIFCKIANGEIPSRTLYEDDDFRVILDLNPATKGHALILPREHYQNLYEIEDSTASKVLPLAKKMAVMMTEKLGCDGFNVVQNNNEIAGQTVFHFHVHLIPRYNDDGQSLVMPPCGMTAEQLDAVWDENVREKKKKNQSWENRRSRETFYRRGIRPADHGIVCIIDIDHSCHGLFGGNTAVDLISVSDRVEGHHKH